MVGTPEVTGPSIPDELAVALAEIESLRAENERLRGLLGLTDDREAEPPVAWESTLFAPAVPARPAVDRRSSPADKIWLFRSLFAGRDDVYALRWQNDRTQKSGWSPAVVGGWPNSKRPDREYEPLTDAVIERHLAGDEVVHGDRVDQVLDDVALSNEIDVPDVEPLGRPDVHTILAVTSPSCLGQLTYDCCIGTLPSFMT
jgi:hypothetical protein